MNHPPRPPAQPLTISPVLIAAAIFLAFAYALVTTSSYRIESGNVGVLATFGKYNEETKEPGLHFMIPFVQNVRTMDVKVQTVHYTGKSNIEEREGVIYRPSIVVLDSKNLNIGVELTVQYRPMQADAPQILARYGNNYFQKLLDPNIREIIRNVAGRYGAEEIAMKRLEIGEELKERLVKKFSETMFEVMDVQLRNIDLPQIVRQKIEEVQLAKQEEQRLAMIEKQAQKNQTIKTIEANTRMIEVTTQAKADAEKKRIEAEAKAYQITKEAEALAEANTRIAESVSSPLLNYRAIEQWDGKYPRMLAGDGKNLLLQIPSQ